MRSDFIEHARSAREEITVPELSIEAIRRRAAEVNRRGVLVYALCGVAVITTLGAGAAYGQRAFEGVRLWLSGGKAAVAISAFAMVRQPMAADVQYAASRADFPIVLPVGLPAGTRLNMMMYSPAERPTAMTILYGGALPTSARFGIDIYQTSSINSDFSTLPSGAERPDRTDVYQWQVGSETVIVSKAHIAVDVMNRIKAAMIKSSPAESLAFTESIARKVWLQPGALNLAAVAERVAPDGRGVVLDQQHVGWIHGLATRGQAMIDSRKVFLTNIPTVNGYPNYAKATLQWPKHVLISTSGVRAIDAVLQRAGIRGGCGCGVVFDNSLPNSYSISILSMSDAHATKTYTVDAGSYSITSAP